MTSGTARWVLRSSVLALVGSMALSGCVSGGNPDDGSTKQPSSSGSGASSSSAPPAKAIQTRVLTVDPPLRIDVLSLGRAANNTVKLRIRLTNTGTDRLKLDGLFTGGQPGQNETERRSSLGGITLVDGTNLKQYYPRLTTDGKCLCTNYPGYSLDGGGTFDSTILYPAPPSNVRNIDIAAQLMPPFTAIPISASSPNYSGDPNPDTAAMQPPLVTPLVSTSDDLDGSKSIDDQGKKMDVRLSSDVLFKLNKATLTSKADGVLKDVASRLDKVSATTVKIDGYTDTSGNDSINNPLSRRRAESVKKALEKLVTRSGIGYQTAGHGSDDPVAPNDSAEGRKKNRRVTVSFRK